VQEGVGARPHYAQAGKLLVPKKCVGQQTSGSTSKRALGLELVEQRRTLTDIKILHLERSD
jgi:hypothetical protein